MDEDEITNFQNFQQINRNYKMRSPEYYKINSSPSYRGENRKDITDYKYNSGDYRNYRDLRDKSVGNKFDYYQGSGRGYGNSAPNIRSNTPYPSDHRGKKRNKSNKSYNNRDRSYNSRTRPRQQRRYYSEFRRYSSEREHVTVYCSNCNGQGHLFKECKKPIKSYGIIAFRRKSSTGNIQVCLIRRKNTISYEAFVRGKYRLSELGIHLERMTTFEKEKIKKLTWEQLYSEICYLRNSKHASRERKKAKDLYDSINVGALFDDITSEWVTPEWEYPKGRKYIEETESECALREFREETNIKEDSVNILSVDPLIETFEGTNKRTYQNQYFIGIVDSDSPEPYIDLNSRNQITEIGDVDWFSMEDAMGLIRDYHVRKKDILCVAYESILNLI